MNNFSDDVAAILAPPAGIHWESSGTIFPLMMGAATAIIEAERVVPRGHVRPDWRVPTLYSAFRSAHEGSNGLFANDADMWKGWLVGFHLGSAQFRLAAAIDRSINGWIVDFASSKNRPSDIDLFSPWIGSRIFILLHILESRFGREGVVVDALEKLELLQGSFVSGGSTDAAETLIQGLTNEVVRCREAAGTTTPKDVELVFTEARITDQLCLSTAFARMNSYKHQVRGPMGTHREGFEVELVMAVGALRFIAGLWHAMNGCYDKKKGPA